MLLREDVDSESVRIRVGGALLQLAASAFVCESCEWDGRSRSGVIPHAVGLTEESRWGSELKNAEQVDLYERLGKMIDTT